MIIKNNDVNSIAFLNMYNTKITEIKPDPNWELVIKFNDSISLFSNNQKLWKLRLPNKYDYTILKSNEQIELLFEIDFSEFHIAVDNINEFGSMALPYGTYSFQLFYKDHLKKHRYAIDSMASNKIEIEYNE